MEFNLKGRKQVVYKSIWGEKSSLKMKIEPTTSKYVTSYKIAGNPEDACEIIKKTFEIKNPEQFDKQYNKAVSGDGNEQEKLLTLHSSSRLSLLTFYNVDEEHPITLDLNGKSIEFNFATFEFKNPVIGNASNIDIVLVSSDKKTVLFLESKLSEYYIGARNKSNLISPKYIKDKYGNAFYDHEWLNSIGIDLTFNSNNKFNLSMQNDGINYLDGFKQMISHYIGIRRRIAERKRIKSDDNSEENRKIADTVLSVIENPEGKIYLGEILYDKIFLQDQKNILDPQEVLKNYGELYSKLAHKMNEEILLAGMAKRFEVLEKELKYSEIMGKQIIVEKTILDFYMKTNDKVNE